MIHGLIKGLNPASNGRCRAKINCIKVVKPQVTRRTPKTKPACQNQASNRKATSPKRRITITMSKKRAEKILIPRVSELVEASLMNCFSNVWSFIFLTIRTKNCSAPTNFFFNEFCSTMRAWFTFLFIRF